MDNSLNKMIFNGILVGSRSYNGLSLDLLRSALKKYTINSNQKKAIWCTIEFDLFKLIGAKAIISNLKNMIILLLIENIGINNLNLIDKITDDIKKISITDLSDDSKQTLINIINELCLSSKNHEVHILENIFKVLFIKKPNLDNPIVNDFLTNISLVPEIKNYHIGDYFISKQENDPIELVEFTDYFIFYLDKNSDNSFFWLYKIYNLQLNKVKCGRRYKRYKPLYVIWEHLKERAIIEECSDIVKSVLDKLLKIFLEKTENISLLVLAVLLFLREGDLHEIGSEYKNICKDNVDNYYQTNIDFNMIEFDNFCVDKNVKEARKLNIPISDNTEDFSLDLTNINKKYIDIYHLLKTKPIKKKKKKKKIDG